MAKSYDLKAKKIWVAGHGGMVGSAIVRRLADEDCDLVTVGRDAVDLCSQKTVDAWMAQTRPQAIFLAAAKVGGIHANNNYPVDFLHENLMIQSNIVEAAHRYGVEKLMFLGSSCIYPREAPQPIREAAMLTGPLEPTNEWYAIAKISGIKLCQAYRQQYGSDFISAMPTNLFGPGDNFHAMNAHVPAALLSRFHGAKIAGKPHVEVWGTGQPRREFLHVDDMADACVFLMKHYSDPMHINIGTGEDISIADFATAIARTVGFEGEISFDTSRPDGMVRKLLDVARLNDLGWRATTSLKDGLAKYYDWFLDNQDRLRR